MGVGDAADNIFLGGAAVDIAGVGYVTDAEEVERKLGAEMARELINQSRAEANAPCEIADAVHNRVEIFQFATVERLVVILMHSGISQRLDGSLKHHIEVHVAVFGKLVAHHRRHPPTGAVPSEEVVVDRHPHTDIIAVGAVVDKDRVAEEVALGREADETAHNTGIEFRCDLVADLQAGEPVGCGGSELGGGHSAPGELSCTVVIHRIEHFVDKTLLIETALQTNDNLCVSHCRNCNNSNQKCYFLHHFHQFFQNAKIHIFFHIRVKVCYFSAVYVFFAYLCNMKKTTIILICLTITTICRAQWVAVDSIWRNDVKTVILSRPGSDLEEPLLSIEESVHQLSLQFDILAEQPETMRWTIKHCDANWHIDDLEPYDFIQGFESGPIDNYDFSFTTLTPYIHYTLTFPSMGARFIYSGNYLLSVSLEDEPDSILLTRRFRVTEQSVKLTAECTLPYDGTDLYRRQEVDAYIEAIPGTAGIMLNQQYLNIIAQQNGRLDNRRELRFSGYDGGALAYRHRQENIFDGGNTFRFFDLSNLRTPMYNVQRVERYGGETFAIITPCENRSRKHYTRDAALNGGMKAYILSAR